MAEISAADASDSSPSTDEKDARNGTTQTRKPPPVISLAMLRRAIGDEIASLDVNEVTRRVYEGVLLKDDEKQGQKDQAQPYIHKYCVDRKLNRNCLMVLASALSITWGNDSQYWTWPEEEESCYSGNVNLPIAVLRGVWWLEIKGKCKTIVLSPRTMYEVAIVVKMSSRNHGWEIPVNLSLELPDGKKQGRMERLDRLEKEPWIHISIGKFETTPKTVGEISFSLTQTDGHWKSGLRVKGVVFTPTTENKQPT